MTAENTIYSEELAKDKYLLELIFNNYYEQERRFQTLESKLSSMMFYWVCLLHKDAIKI